MELFSIVLLDAKDYLSKVIFLCLIDIEPSFPTAIRHEVQGQE